MKVTDSDPEESSELLFREIRAFTESEFGSEPHLAFIYGSWAYNLQNSDSDVDLMIIAETVTKNRIERTVKWVVDLFQRHGLNTDE